MKKILVVDFNGTSSVYTHYFSKGIIRKKDNLKILGKKKPDFLDVFSDLNTYVGVNTKFKFLNYCLNWFWLLFNCKKFDLVIVQWLQLLKFSPIEVKLISYLQSKTKLIYILHNLYPHNTNKDKILKNYNSLYKILNKIAVHTLELKEAVLKINPDANVLKIEHGFFFKEFRNKNIVINEKKCLMIGYISKYKGIEDALKVVKNLKDRNVFIKLEIIGLASQKYLDHLFSIINNFKIEGQVTIISKEVSTGFLINKINESIMLWLPYEKISQSGVSYTSIGLSKPFVGYNVGNFKESFGNYGVAEIVEQKNINEFSNAVVKILNNESYYRKNIESFGKRNIWESNKKILN